MGNLRFFLIVAVFCAVFGDALSQNRGSVRYGSSSSDVTDDADVESTRPQVPNRSVRRRRPTSAPEPPPAAAEIQSHPQETTTGRRVPPRSSSPRFGSQSPSHPIEEPAAPVLPEVAYDVPQAPPVVPEDKSQSRRRRPKKRRRPQAEKKDIDNADVKKEDSTPKNVEDKPLRPYLGDSELRNDQNSYDSSGPPVNFDDNVDDPGRRNSGAQYFPPQTGTNRLPLENAEEIENARKYSEQPQSAPNSDISSRRYVPSEPESSRGAYVPVLNPVRVPAETHDQYTRTRDEARTRQDRPSDTHHQRRTPGHRSPISNHDEITRSSDAKSPQNQNTRSSQANIPSRRHPEVRLIPADPPQVPREYDRSFNNQPQYGNPVVVSVLGGQRQDGGRLHENGSPQATNRLPNPSEDHYKLVYPYLDENLNSEHDSHSSLPYRRDETASHNSGDAIIPYSNVIPNDTDEPAKSANDTDNDNRELSRYEPPLPRSGASSQSRNPEEDKTELPTRSRDSTRSRSQTRTETLTRTRGPASDTPVIPIETPTRQRGTSRYQPDSSIDQPTRTQDSTRYASDSAPDTSTRTRGSTRNQPDTSVDKPTRARGSNRYTTDASLDAITRTRGSTRNQPDASPDTAVRTRTSSRRQPDSAIDTPTPTRGSSRRQPNIDVDTSTPGSSRYQPDSSIDRPTRTRSSQAEVPSTQRYRNTQRYPDAEDESRLTSRRQQSIPEVISDTDTHSPPQIYPQIVPERREPSEEAAPAPFSAYADPTHRPDQRDATDPVRNTLRSRPQFEVRQPEEPYPYEEPSEDEQDSNVYVPEYQPPQQEVRNQRVPPSQREQPRQPSARENVDQRTAPRQQQPDYRSPQPSTRRQPQSQHPAPQSERPQTRQPARQQTRPRQDPVAPTPNHGRSSGGSKFACPDAYGFFADPVQCDKYYECRNGTAVDGLCDDGLAFNVAAAPRFLRCDSLRDVDCTSRPELQEPRPTAKCPRRYGLYPDEEDCTRFFNCVDGTATQVQCPPGLTFNDDRATCDWADLVKSSCKTEDLLGFTCPEPSAYDLQDGVYTSYPHPDNCQLHFVCIKGDDGERRPRMLACNEGLVYSPQSASCTRPDDVPGCEDFYGSLSPAPKRKPSRDPLPAEPEPLDEDPKPRRRVVQQNRRNRN